MAESRFKQHVFAGRFSLVLQGNQSCRRLAIVRIIDTPAPVKWFAVHTKRFLEHAPALEMRINFKSRDGMKTPTDVQTSSSLTLKFVMRLLKSAVFG